MRAADGRVILQEADMQEWEVVERQVPRAQRFQLQLPLQYRLDDDSQWQPGRTLNISCTGVLFEAARLLPVNADIQIRLQLLEASHHWAEHSSGQLLCEAQVLRVASDRAGNPCVAAAITRYQFPS